MKKAVDIHGMTVPGARAYLKNYLNTLDRFVTEVEIIHGYNQGQNLQRLIRKEFKHKRVEKCIYGLNKGSTTLIIKK